MSAMLSSCCRSLVTLTTRTAATAALLRPALLSTTTLAAPAGSLSATSAAMRLHLQSSSSSATQTQVRSYQVRASIKPRCEHCYMVMRKGRRYILCKKVARHKQRQG